MITKLVDDEMQTDKASMLDEIIEYVRFLQLQVKVLSMSRLGGAGAVGPRLNGLSAEVSFLVPYGFLHLYSCITNHHHHNHHRHGFW